MSTPDFVHLHVHTEFSLQDSSAKIGELVSRIKELGMTACAVTDHGNIFALPKFYRECKKQGIKPILGSEIYVCTQGKTAKVRDNRHLILLVENEIGYKNLMLITSDARQNGQHYNPRTDFDFLREHSEGLIATSACLGGVVAKEYEKVLYEHGKIFGNDSEEAKSVAYARACEMARELKSIFGEDNFFLEIQDNQIPEQYVLNEMLHRMSQELKIPLVATNDIHYVNPEDAEYHDVLMAMQAGTTIENKNRKIYGSSEFYINSPEQMNTGRLCQESIENTVKIADRCNFDFEFGHYHIPTFDVPEGFKDAEAYLRHLVQIGFDERYTNFEDQQLVKDRIDHEIGIISEMGFIDYFLITWDFIKYAKDNDIPVGPGRGSGAGSAVCFCLRITDVEPLAHDLLFERFLNPARVSMPDWEAMLCS